MTATPRIYTEESKKKCSRNTKLSFVQLPHNTEKERVNLPAHKIKL